MKQKQSQCRDCFFLVEHHLTRNLPPLPYNGRVDILGKGRRNYDHISDDNGSEVSKLLKIIGDLERISDHSVNVLESAEELQEKKIIFSPGAKKELEVLCSALDQILNLTVDALRRNDFGAAASLCPVRCRTRPYLHLAPVRRINPKLPQALLAPPAGLVF